MPGSSRKADGTRKPKARNNLRFVVTKVEAAKIRAAARAVEKPFPNTCVPLRSQSRKGETSWPSSTVIDSKRMGFGICGLRDNFSVDGQIIRKQKCVKLAEYSDRYRNESDLDDLAAEKMANVRQAAKCAHSCDLFASFVEGTYLPYVKENKKPSTFCACYRDHWRLYLKPRTAHLAVRDFTMAIASNLLADIAAAHPVNIGTIEKVRSILSGMFSYALATGAFPGKSETDNPCAGALLPKAMPKRETVAATLSDVKAILARLKEEGLTLARAAVAICAYTGVRPGELRGLQWRNWDRAAEQLHVQRSVWHTHETMPKTKQSIRFVAVSDGLKQILSALWKSQGCPINGYILARSDGGRVNLDNESKRVIAPALSRCAVCKQAESAEHKGHTFSATKPYRIGAAFIVCGDSTPPRSGRKPVATLCRKPWGTARRLLTSII